MNRHVLNKIEVSHVISANVEAEVAVVKGRNPKVMIDEAFELIGGIDDILKGGESVLVKPNAQGPQLPEEPPGVTDPQVVAALVKTLKDAGAGRVVVGENPMYGLKARYALRNSGIEDAALNAGAEVSYFDEEPYVEIDIPEAVVWRKIRLPKPILEADIRVSVPKMKTSGTLLASLGIKNYQGLFLWEDKKNWHREIDLAHKLVDTLRVVKPHLVVMDAITAMEGNGPVAGTPKRMDLILAGRDVVAVDAVASAIMGFDPMEVYTTQIATAQGLGVSDLNRIRVKGKKIEEVRQFFKRPIVAAAGAAPNVTVYAGGVCKGCKIRLASTPTEIRSDKRYAVITGYKPFVPPDVNLEEAFDEVWVLGDCAADHVEDVKKYKFVPGCPPLDWSADIYKKKCGQQSDEAI